MSKTITLPTSHIINLSINSLKPSPYNARTHSTKQIRKIASSIEKFGFVGAVYIDSNNNIIAGHGRVEAAKLLEMEEVPTLCVEHLTPEQIRAYMIADNRLAELAGWDEKVLAIEFEYLVEQNFEIEVTGFETAEVDFCIDGVPSSQEDDPTDKLPETSDNQIAVTQLGDIYVLGQHRLICGDAIKEKTYRLLMESKVAHAVISDPPFNVKIQGHVCGSGKIKHREFAMATGEMSEEQFIDFLASFITYMVKFSKDGSLHYLFMDWRHLYELISAGKQHYSELKNICIWNKTNGGMGSFYRSKHEMVVVFKNGTESHINNVELGKYGRYRTNVWDYKGVNSFGSGQKDLEMHPTVKPVAMIIDAIKDCTKRNDIVLDAFTGSGTTLIACEKSGRIARCIELDPLYCDLIVRRWQELTGKDAILQETGETFNQRVNAQEVQ